VYIPKHFRIEELVSKTVFRKYGKQAFQFFDDRALKTLDRLRERFGPATVNDWLWGGPNDSRGFRAIDDPEGADNSAHRRAQGFDVIFKEISAEEVREYILRNPDEFPYINAIEANVNWLHFDCRNCQRIMVFKPKKTGDTA